MNYVITMDIQMRCAGQRSNCKSHFGDVKCVITATQGEDLTTNQRRGTYFIIRSQLTVEEARSGHSVKTHQQTLHLYSQTLSCHQQLVEILWWLLRPKEEPNSTKPQAKGEGEEEGEKKEKRTPTVDISIRRNEILNIFIIPSICSYFSLHTAIFPFSLLSYWHGAQGLERNLSFII